MPRTTLKQEQIVVDGQSAARVIATAVEAGRDPSLWSDVASLASAALAADTAAVIFWGANGTSAVRSCPHTDPALHTRYDAEMHAMNYLWDRATARPAGSVSSESTLGGRRQYHRSTIFNEFLRPQGADSILLLTLTKPASPTRGILTLGRSRRREPFGTSDLANAAAICDALARTISATGAAWQIPAKQAVDEVELLVTPDGRLLSRDAMLVDLVRGGLLEIRRGMVIAECLPGLARAIADAGRSPGDWPPPIATSLGPIAIGDGCFRVGVCPGGTSAPGAVRLIVRRRSHQNPLGRFARRFGLTAREAEVAACLAAGMTLPEAAIHLGVELTTARTHLGRLFDKTDTRSQLSLGLLAARALNSLAE
mgnify:CR=1 FL=1